jgi:hypothetical protein
VGPLSVGAMKDKDDSAVTRSSRTFELKLSPSGVELFLDCHYRLCQQTNELLPYGQTLFCALLHLRHIPAVRILDDLLTIKESGLLGEKACFVGAPSQMAKLASTIAERICRDAPGNRRPIIAWKLFMIALKQFRLAHPEDLRASYEDMVREAGDLIKLPARLKGAASLVRAELRGADQRE